MKTQKNNLFISSILAAGLLMSSCENESVNLEDSEPNANLSEFDASTFITPQNSEETNNLLIGCKLNFTRVVEEGEVVSNDYRQFSANFDSNGTLQIANRKSDTAAIVNGTWSSNDEASVSIDLTGTDFELFNGEYSVDLAKSKNNALRVRLIDADSRIVLRRPCDVITPEEVVTQEEEIIIEEEVTVPTPIVVTGDLIAAADSATIAGFLTSNDAAAWNVTSINGDTSALAGTSLVFSPNEFSTASLDIAITNASGTFDSGNILTVPGFITRGAAKVIIFSNTAPALNGTYNVVTSANNSTIQLIDVSKTQSIVLNR